MAQSEHIFDFEPDVAGFNKDVQALIIRYGNKACFSDALKKPENLGDILKQSYLDNFKAAFPMGVVFLTISLISLANFDTVQSSLWNISFGLFASLFVVCASWFWVGLNALNALHNVGLKHLIPFHPPGRWWNFL